MADSGTTIWGDRAPVRMDREQPYLRVQTVMVFVRDQDESLKFYRDQLGFGLAFDTRLASGDRWVAVEPPDGNTVLALVTPKPDEIEFALIGQGRHVVFVSEDVDAVFRAWSARGVFFHHPPTVPPWGGVFTTFEDIDHNTFSLVGFDEVTRLVEAQRRAHQEKMEAERRAAQELEFAKQVQARLFPQALPPCPTLDYAGVCLQARQVGGDYYDFLDLGDERLGLIIGDISGKGMAAALLMANLQANLRGQSASASAQPQRLLQSANRLFYQNTGDSAYATLFFAEYDKAQQRLRYANCGHLPALLLRQDGTLEQLASTATVLGLFEHWDTTIEQRQLSAGDTLVLYTDGVTESFDGKGEEFGEERLVETLRGHPTSSAEDVIEAVVEEVGRFSERKQQDDITLIVAKCRTA